MSFLAVDYEPWENSLLAKRFVYVNWNINNKRGTRWSKSDFMKVRGH